MVTARQLFAAMMIPTAMLLLRIVLDTIRYHRLSRSLDRFDETLDSMKQFRL